jgi:hypothetical protein
MYRFRYDIVIVMLMVCLALTAAGSNRNGRDGAKDVESSLMPKSIARSVTSKLAISDEQRGHIFDSVMRMSDAPVANGPSPEIADLLPEEVPMQDLPAGVTQDIPLAQGHKFVKFDDRILIVNPSSRLVVALIPRYKPVP